MARSLNKVQLIGNLTRDPELRYTPAGTAVCTFGLATNRQWVTDSGEKKDAADFHRLVAWSKLAEICAQLLKKGRKVYVEGRLSTRSWTGQDGVQRQTTEIVISDMIILDKKGDMVDESTPSEANIDIPDDIPQEETPREAKPKPESTEKTKTDKKKKEKKEEEPSEEDIPF